MCSPVALIGTATLIQGVSGISSAANSYNQGKAQSDYYNKLAEQSRAEGAYALKVGEAQSKAVQDTQQIEGRQLKENQGEFNASVRAQLAANGITGVTAEDIVSNNLSKESMDEFLLRRNADLKSHSIKTGAEYDNWAKATQALDYEYAGRQAKSAGKQQAFNTLLSTAANTAWNISSMGFGGKSGTVPGTGKTQSQLLGYSTKRFR